jgi:capsular polysaccharide biosynthesis protein
MRRQSILVLAMFVLVVAPAVAAIWTQVVPEYRARAELRVRPIIPCLEDQPWDSGMIPLYESFVNTQVSIIRSLAVLQRVLDQQEVQETQWYKKPRKSLVQWLLRNSADHPIERLRDSLSIQPRRQTEIIDVTFVDSSAEDAKLILDTVLGQYIRHIGTKSDVTKDKLYRLLVDQHTSLKNEIEGRGKIIAELSRSLGTGTPQELVSSKRIRLDETQARLSKLQQSIAISEWERKELEDLMKQAITDDSNDASAGKMEKQPGYYEDAEWRALDRNVRIIRHQIATSELDPKNPDMVQAAKDMKFAKELLRLREVQLDKQWRDRLKNTAGEPIATIVARDLHYEEGLRTLEYQLARAQQEEKLLLAQLEKQQTEFQGVFESAQLLEKENNALLHKRALFDATRKRLDQRMGRNIPSPVEVLSWASVSSKPYKDRRIMFTAMVLVIGSIGVGCVSWLLGRKRML